MLNTKPLLSAKTTKAGTFVIDPVPAGSYTLVFSRAGLSTFVLPGVVHSRNDAVTTLPQTYTLVQEPDTRVSDLQATAITASAPPVPAINFKTTITSPQPTPNFSYVLYFGLTPDVSFLTSTSSVTVFSSASQASTAQTINYTADRKELVARGFDAPSGTTAYAVAYSVGSASSYISLTTGQQVHWPNPSLSSSSVVSFVVP